jgi:hypothetical protein
MGPGFPHGSSPWAEGPRDSDGEDAARRQLDYSLEGPGPIGPAPVLPGMSDVA